jgi:transcriptional regulator with XRE-family HTH domain
VGNRRFIDPEPFPQFFKAWRDYRGMTQAEVEAKYGWPASRVSNLESGRATITGHVLMALARAYRCSVADLIGRDPGPKKPFDQIVGDDLQSFGLGAAPLHDALKALARLAGEAKDLRAEVLPRLSALEAGVSDVADRITDALQDAKYLADAFDRAAASLRKTTSGSEPKD